MVKKSTKRILMVLPLLISMILMLTYCSKEKPFSTSKESDIALKAKQDWSKIDYGHELRQDINDSTYLQWVPRWNETGQEEKEGHTYTYVPLGYEVKSNDEQIVPLTVTSNKQMYLLIKEDQAEKKFYIETFVEKSDGEGDKDMRLMSGSSKRSGSLTLKEINRDNVFSYTYNNGVGTASYLCTYQTECHWYSASPCNGSILLTLSLSPVSEEPYRYHVHTLLPPIHVPAPNST